MLSKMKVGTKILAGFGLALAITVVVGAVGLTSTQRIGGQLDDIANARFPSAQALASMSELQAKIERDLATLMVRRLTDQELRRGLQDDIHKKLSEMDDAKKGYDAIPHSEETLRLVGRGEKPVDRCAVRVGPVFMKHEADQAIADSRQFPVGELADLSICKPIGPFCGTIQAPDQVHESGFARPRRPPDGDKFAGRHF